MSARRPALLIVDDEERIRRLLVEYLDDYGEFQVRVAASAEAGLRVLAREPADLCVVDMRLPAMDGEAFILEAVALGLCRRFILHTGSVDVTLSDALRAAGLTDRDVFLKPSDMQRLLERVRALLDSLEG